MDKLYERLTETKENLSLRYAVDPAERRLVLASDSLLKYYSKVRNALMCYPGMERKCRRGYEFYIYNGKIVCKLCILRQCIKIFLAIDHRDAEAKYYLQNVSHLAVNQETPSMMRVRSMRSTDNAIALIRRIAKRDKIKKDKRYRSVDFAALYASVDCRAMLENYEEYCRDSMSAIEASECEVRGEELRQCVEIVDGGVVNKFKPINKYCIYTDTLSAHYARGQEIDISRLISDGLLPVEENIYLEVHGRGVVDKPLYITAHSFDMSAIKQILLTRGVVRQYRK